MECAHEEGYEPKDVMVLTPRRRIGYRIRNRLRELGVNVHSFYHEEALEAADAQESFNLLTLMAQPDDRVAYRWWLGVGSQTWRAGAYERVWAHCRALGASPRDVVGGIVDGTMALAGTRDLALREEELRARLARLGALPMRDLIDVLFPDGSDDHLALREAAVVALPDMASVEDLHERLRNQIAQPDMPEAGDFVRVMSLHKSKGLTSKVVIVAGVIEGLMPTRDDRATPDEQVAILEEQRRLFYVALTRCTEVLVISSARNIPLREARQMGASVGRGGLTIASRFMDELGGSAPPPIVGATWRRAADPA